jgi:hypothetical protein
MPPATLALLRCMLLLLTMGEVAEEEGKERKLTARVCVRVSVNSAWLRDECVFIAVAAVERLRTPSSKHPRTASIIAARPTVVLTLT